MKVDLNFESRLYSLKTLSHFPTLLTWRGEGRREREKERDRKRGEEILREAMKSKLQGKKSQKTWL